MLLAVALVLSLGAAEITLRLLGFTPLAKPPSPDVPLMHEPDPELGWRNEPGEYVFGDPAIRMTMWPGGFRATAPERVPRGRPILMLGGSFVQGWAVSDAETSGWALQQAFPETEVLNLGTGGYGTYQSLLALERFLEESSTPPSLVIYGFAVFHQARNVASTKWLRMLAGLSHHGPVDVPYASLDADGGLVRNPPLGYPDWEPVRRLATVAQLQEAYVKLRGGRRRVAQSQKVTERLMVEMARVTRGAGADFMVVALSNLARKKKQSYLIFLRREGIAVADCAHPGEGDPALSVPLYGHPNARANAYWTKCIIDRIRRMRAEPAPPSE
jgi:hypothetical protein